VPPVGAIERLETVIVADVQLPSKPCLLPPQDAGGDEAELRMDEPDASRPRTYAIAPTICSSLSKATPWQSPPVRGPQRDRLGGGLPSGARFRPRRRQWSPRTEADRWACRGAENPIPSALWGARSHSPTTASRRDWNIRCEQRN